MTFDELRQFIDRDMRMSHVYQPVMLRTLLDAEGTASADQIARALLAEDRSQIEYYTEITRDMVGRVLRDRGVVEREGATYRLGGFDALTPEQIGVLREACERKLAEYVAKRGAAIWEHRRQSKGYISGTLRYEVLKAAKFHCELCGIAADERALEVDHIVPRNAGGPDDPSNLQALCYRCNAMKRDRDATDFRAVRTAYAYRQAGCAFCELPADRFVVENELAVAIEDRFPVTPLHSLVIPKRHVSSYFELGAAEAKACGGLLERMRTRIREQDASVAGFNVGINDGEAAGQTVFHCHLHLIPRRAGDTPNPRGGVRHVMPGKGDYA